MNITTIQPQSLFDKYGQGEPLELIDVRTPVEYHETHIDTARNIPLDRLDPVEIRSNQIRSGTPLYVICRTGGRASKACQQLQNGGCTDVVSVDGGMLAWDQAGLPVVRGRQVISLERQVRIAAGLLVLLGVLLAWAIHPVLIGLSVFVGAGLVFAGVTDTCGMGLMLARMPWNRVSESSHSTTCQI